MPAITPNELIEYTVFEEIKTRKENLLLFDIIEAETEVVTLVGHSFSATEQFPNGFPQEAKLAVLKLAQFYALVNSDEAIIKGYSGEKIGDYSYTYKGETIQKPDVTHLLKKYMENGGRTKVAFRMSKL